MPKGYFKFYKNILQSSPRGIIIVRACAISKYIDIIQKIKSVFPVWARRKAPSNNIPIYNIAIVAHFSRADV